MTPKELVSEVVAQNSPWGSEPIAQFQLLVGPDSSSPREAARRRVPKRARLVAKAAKAPAGKPGPVKGRVACVTGAAVVNDAVTEVADMATVVVAVGAAVVTVVAGGDVVTGGWVVGGVGVVVVVVDVVVVDVVVVVGWQPSRSRLPTPSLMSSWLSKASNHRTVNVRVVAAEVSGTGTGSPRLNWPSTPSIVQYSVFFQSSSVAVSVTVQLSQSPSTLGAGQANNGRAVSPTSMKTMPKTIRNRFISLLSTSPWPHGASYVPRCGFLLVARSRGRHE